MKSRGHGLMKGDLDQQVVNSKGLKEIPSQPSDTRHTLAVGIPLHRVLRPFANPPPSRIASSIHR
jgi:hypothetical protein